MNDVVGETRQTYDLIAPKYAERKKPYRELLDDLRTFASVMPLGSRVADIGCGPGQEVRLLRDEGYAAFGFDFSAAQLRAGGVDGVAQADMRQLPIGTGTLDAVWCLAALLHIPRAEVATVLGEFARVVRHGGRLVLMVAEGDGERWEDVPYTTDGERRWFTYHREPELTASLMAAGYTVDHTRRHSGHRDWLALHAVRHSG